MIRPHLQCARLAIACSALLMLGGPPVSAQTTPSSPTTQPVPDATKTDPGKPEPKADNPGLINELGKLLVKPSDLFPSLKISPDTASPAPSPTQPQDTRQDTSTAPPPAAASPPASGPASAPSTTATAPAKPPAPGLVPQVVRGRASCPTASNGAPDCKAGADKLCQEKGFAGGSSLDMDSAKTCSTKALLEGARHIRDICKNETFVTRAMCQ